MPTLYTVGHGARSIEEFLAVLQRAGIEVLVDVRRYPGSRRHPQFGREALAARLRPSSIRYEWWGESMGGRRTAGKETVERHGAWELEAFRAYAGHMETPEFRNKLAELLALARRLRVAVMCAETLWWRCHRRLIADAALVAGFEVTHLGAGADQPHELTKSARVDERGMIVYDRVTLD